jgi:molecular chaperone DnaK (HSP70)
MSGIILSGFSTRAPNVQPSIAQPLPRLTPQPTVNQDEGERYEVVISGVMQLFPLKNRGD